MFNSGNHNRNFIYYNLAQEMENRLKEYQITIEFIQIQINQVTQHVINKTVIAKKIFDNSKSMFKIEAV